MATLGLWAAPSHALVRLRSCQSVTSLFSAAVSPVKDGPPPPARWSGAAKPALRALYDLLIAPMEGVRSCHTPPARRPLRPLILLSAAGPDARQRAGGPEPAAGSGSGGRAVPGPVRLAQRQRLQRVPVRALRPRLRPVSGHPGGGGEGRFHGPVRFRFEASSSSDLLSAPQAPPPRRAAPPADGGSLAAVVGAPRLPPSIMGRWLWGPLPSAQEEALWLGEQLGCRPLTGANATKERVLAALSQAECVHVATHISWKLAALVLAPAQDGAQEGGADQNRTGSFLRRRGGLRGAEEGSDGEEGLCDTPPLQDFLLTAADVLDLNLTVKLLVLRYRSDHSRTFSSLLGSTAPRDSSHCPPGRSRSPAAGSRPTAWWV